MALYDFAGFPFPLSHPDFKSDEALLRKLDVLGTYVEMLREYRDAFEIVQALMGDDVEQDFSNFGMLALRMPDMLLSYAILQYAKPFVESKGSTNLIGKENVISDDANFIEFHNFVMNLRHQFYAHRELNINRHQINVMKNYPEPNDIELITEGQSKIMIVYKSIELEMFSANICAVAKHIQKTVAGLKNTVLAGLTDKQREYLLDTDIEELRTKHMDDGNKGMTHPFESRVTKSSKPKT